MLKRLRHHLNPALVISVIALFAALSGGYALAFSGSGQLQKAKFTPTATMADARSLDGFGVIRLQCDGPNNEVEFEFENTQASSVIIRTYSQNENDFSSSSLGTLATGGGQTFPGVETTTFHIYRNDTSKAAVTGTITSAAAGNLCSSSSILALNSVE